VNDEPEWPVAGRPPPDVSPYPSVLSSANPDSYEESPQPATDPAERRKMDRAKVVGAGPKHRASDRLPKTAPISSVYAAAQATSARAHPSSTPPAPVPQPPAPVPQVPAPQVPAPQVPAPQVPAPQVPAPQVPAPQAGPTAPAQLPPPQVPPAHVPPAHVPPAHVASGPPVTGQVVLPYPVAVPAAAPAARGRQVKPIYVRPDPPAAKATARDLFNRRVITLLVVLVLVPALGLLGYFYVWPAWVEAHATMVAPNNVIGLNKIDDPSRYAYPKTVLAQLRDTGLGAPVVAGYAAGDDPAHVVLVLGGTEFLLDPDGYLDDLFDAIGSGKELPLTDVEAVRSGPMGGATKCANGTFQTEPVAVCGWADHGSAAILVFYHRTTAEGAKLMRAIRPEVLHRTWH
jgi:hypothetical protein